MIYPIFTFEDGTEVTASKPDKNGDIKIYVEKFDVNKDMFVNATFIIPNVKLISSTGYDDCELEHMLKNFNCIEDDILEYVMDKVKQIA